MKNVPPKQVLSQLKLCLTVCDVEEICFLLYLNDSRIETRSQDTWRAHTSELDCIQRPRTTVKVEAVVVCLYSDYGPQSQSEDGVLRPDGANPGLPHISSMFCAARAFRGANQFGLAFPV